MKLKFLSIFLSIACTFISVAKGVNSLSGKVIHKESKEAIPGAAIYLYDDPNIATLTDINGNYKLAIQPGNVKIVCSYIGMENDTLVFICTSNSELQHDFILKAKEISLQTLVVSASRYEQKLEEITVSMEVLKPQLIEHKNTSNIKTALDQVPGLTILDGEPQIRGGSGFSFGVGSRVATLIDGIPVMAGDAGRTEWNFIPVENIEQIEIIKGASSVCFGSSALSGTINIRTAYAKDKPITKTNVYSGFYSSPKNEAAKWWKGNANISGITFFHSEKNKELDWIIGGLANYDHGYIGPPLPHPLLPIKSDTITDDDVSEKNARINFNLRYKPKNFEHWTLGINGNAMLSHSNFSLVWNDDTSGIYRSFPGTMTLTDRSIFYLDPYVNHTTKNGFKQDLRMRYFFTDNQNSNNQSNQSNVYYSEYQAHKSIGKENPTNLTAGLVSNIVNSKANLYSAGGSPQNKLSNYAIYSQIDKHILKRVTLSAGLRGEYFKINQEKSRLQPIFRSGLNLELTKATFVRCSYGEGYRYPTITEKFIFTSTGGITIFPNDSLLAESSSNSEIGLKQGFKIGEFKGFIDAAYFYQRYGNTIEYIYAKWSPDSAGFKFVNTGNTKVDGVDVSIAAEGKVTPNLSLSFLGGYTYTNPQSEDTSYVFAKDRPADGFTPSSLTFANTSTDAASNCLKYRFKHIAKADIELTYKNLSLGGSWRFFSFMKNIDKTFYDLDEPYLLPTGIKRYRKEHDSGTHIFDTRIAYQTTKSLRVALVVANLFNKEYSLRPLKIESPRSIVIQLALKL